MAKVKTYKFLGYYKKTPVYDMKGKLNDQKAKPRLGNSPILHGKVNTDNAGGSGPSRNRPVKTSK